MYINIYITNNSIPVLKEAKLKLAKMLNITSKKRNKDIFYEKCPIFFLFWSFKLPPHSISCVPSFRQKRPLTPHARIRLLNFTKSVKISAKSKFNQISVYSKKFPQFSYFRIKLVFTICKSWICRFTDMKKTRWQFQYMPLINNYKKCIKFATGAGVERRFWKYYIVMCGLSFPPIDFIKFYNRFVFGTNRVLYPSPLPLPSASPNSFLCSLNHLL